MLLLGPRTWRLEAEAWKRRHRKWFVACLLVALALTGWYIGVVHDGAVPGAGNSPGLACGILAGLLVLYLSAFGLRRAPGFRLWFDRLPAAEWMAQHLWFGLLTFPLVALHSGLFGRWGGLLSTAVLAVYLLVFFSGLWGLWMQQRTPRQLLQEVPDEVNPYLVAGLPEQFRSEAELLVLATCGPPEEDREEALALLEKNRETLRAVQAGRGSGLLRLIPPSPLPNTEALRYYFRSVIDPYLCPPTPNQSAVRLWARMKADFNELRQRVDPAAGPIIDALEGICERRRQLDEQARLQRWLHGWIAVHQSLSAALVVLLLVHAAIALLY